MSLILGPMAEPSNGICGTGRRLAFSFIALLITLSACDDPSAEEFLRRAEGYRETGDIAASTIELKNALQKDPKNGRGRYLLGLNQLAVRNLESAEKELLRAKDYGIQVDALAEPLSQIWLIRGEHEMLLQQLRAEDGASGQAKASILVARGTAHQALGDLEAAGDAFDQAAELDPDNVLALVGRARIAMQQGKDQEVGRLVGRAIERAPEDLNVRALKGDYDFRRGDYQSAAAQYQRVLNAQPNSIAVRFALARSQMFLSKTEEAVTHLDAILARDRGHRDASYLRASLALEAEDYEAAVLYAEGVLLTTPDHLPSLLIAGVASYIRGHLEQANHYLAAALAADPANNLARRVQGATRARLHLAKENGTALRPLLDDSAEPGHVLAAFDPNTRRRADLAAGRDFLRGLPNEYREAVLSRDSQEDSPKQAIARLERAIEADPYALVPRALLGQVYLGDGQPEKTLEVARIALRDHPHHPVLLVLVGLAQLHGGQPGQAKLNFRTLVDTLSQSPTAQYLLTFVYRDEADRALYRDRLEQVLELDPGHLGAQVDLARWNAEAGQLDAATRMVDGLLQSAPDDARVLDLAGAIALLRGRVEEAAGLFEKAAAREASATAMLKLAYAQERAGDRAGSRLTLQHWLDRAPEDVPVRLVLANKYLAIGELEPARAHYAKIILLSPNHIVALNNLAWVNLQLGNPDAALPYIERGHQLAPDDPRIIDTLGLVQLRSGQTEDAVRTLRRARQRRPDALGVQVHLARALAEQGQAGEAREILEQVLSQDTEFSEQEEAKALLRKLGK